MAKDVITRFRLETTQFDSKLRDEARRLAEFSRQAALSGKEFGKFADHNAEAARSLGELATSATNTKDKLKELVGAYNDYARAYNSLSEDQKQTDFAKGMAASLERLQQRIRDTKQELYSVGDAVNHVKASANGMDDLLGGVAGKFGLNPQMATGIGAAVAAAGIATRAISDNINTAMNFEKSISALSALTGMVGKDLDKLKEYSIELGSQTTLTASQVADAFRLIGSQQPQLLSSGEALKEVTKYAITLSEAAGIDLATASQTLSTSINQMGGESLNAARFVNVLAAASQKGAGDIAWLGEAVTKSGTYARAVGASYEELVANLETLAQAGYDASTAGTALRSIILALEKQSDSALKPSVVGLTEAFANLSSKQLDISGYAALVNQRFAAQAMTLAENSSATQELTEAITGTGIAEQQAETNVNNLSGALKQLESAWEGLNLHINDSNSLLTPFVSDLSLTVREIDSLVSKLGALKQSFEENPFFRFVEYFSSQSAINAIKGVIPGGMGLSFGKIALDAIAGNPSEEGNKTPFDRSKFQNPYSGITGKFKSSIPQDYHPVDMSMLDGLKDDVSTTTKSVQELQNQIKALKKLRDEAANNGNRALRDEYNKQIKTAEKELKDLRGGVGTPTTRGQTPQDKAAGIVKAAEEQYAQTMKEASLRMEAGLDDSLAYKKKELSAQEQLFGAYGRAYAVYADPKYKAAYDQAASAYQSLASEVKGVSDAQEGTKKAAHELEQAEKRLAEARRKQAEAEESGSYTDIKKARKAVFSAQEEVARVLTENPSQQSRISAGVTSEMKVVYTVEVNDEQLQKLKAIESEQDIRVNVVEGDVELPDVPKDEQDIRVNVVQGDVDLPDVPSTYTITIEADTADAISAVDELTSGLSSKRVVVPVVRSEPIDVNYTQGNMSGFVSDLKSRIDNADLGSSLYRDLTSQLADATTLGNLMQTAIQNGIDVAQFDPQALWSKVFGESPGDYVSDIDWQGLIDEINAQLKDLGVDPIKINFETGGFVKEGQAAQKSWQSAAQAVSSVGNALQQIQDPSAKVAGLIGQAIAQIALGFATATTAAASAGPFAWIAAVAGGLATMLSTIEAIKSATHYASGGIVGGNDYSDNTPVMVSSGELILNRAQQNSIAAQLDDASRSTDSMPYVNGEQIWLGLSNYLARTGRGEIVTSRGR